MACKTGEEGAAEWLQGLGTASRDDLSLSDGCGGDDHQTKASKKLTEEPVPPGSELSFVLLVNQCFLFPQRDTRGTQPFPEGIV